MTEFDPYVTPQAAPGWQFGLDPKAGGGAAVPDRMDYYVQLGQQLLQQQAAMQQMMAQQQQRFVGPGGGGTQPLQRADTLATGFDFDWLSQRLAAGSANGAKIGGMGMGGGGGGGGADLPVGGMGAGWDNATTPKYSGMKGAGKLMR